MPNASNPPPIIRGQTESPDACIIWLHGLGADATDFAPIVPQLNLPDHHSIKFVFPNAPHIPVTVNAGYIMPAWYDILELTEERVINEQDLAQSVAYIHSLIEDQVKAGIDPSRILLIGFSQGGAVTYHAALSYAERLAGVIGLSTYFPQIEAPQFSEANQAQNILICHGSRDAMVLERQGKASADRLRALGHTISYKSYPMEHEVCMTELADISAQIQSLLC